jgi:hypothetical protein
VRRKSQSAWFTKIQGWFGLFVLGMALLLIPYNILRNVLLSHSGANTRAVIINQENYFGNNTRRFAYSYRFYLDSRPYIGNSLNSKYLVGDSVWVRYVPFFPRFNQISELTK